MEVNGSSNIDRTHPTSVGRSEPPRLCGEVDDCPEVYVVLPVFNRKALVERFLGMLRAQTFRRFQTVVVDDGSTDGTSQMIAECFPEVHLLHGDGTLWWTGGINRGIRHVLSLAREHDSVLVINDDVDIGPNYLASLHQVLRTLPGTIVGSVVVRPDDPHCIVDGGRIVNWWTAKMSILNTGQRLSDFPQGHVQDVELLTGWGTLLPVSVFREVGLYNERHFKQCGDTVLPVRAKNRGYRLVVSYSAPIGVYLGMTADINVAPEYRISDINRYFFSVRSNFRLAYRFFFAVDTATNPLKFTTYLLCDVARLTWHFIARLRLSVALAMFV